MKTFEKRAKKLLKEYSSLKNQVLDTNLHHLYDAMLYDIKGFNEELYVPEGKEGDEVLLNDLKNQVKAVRELVKAEKKVSFTFG